MSAVVDRLGELFDPARLTTSFVTNMLPDLMVALVSFIAFYFLWRLADKTSSVLLARTEMDQTATSFIQLILKYVLLAIGVVTALDQVGIDTASLLTSLGVAGLTLGFAAKDVLSNIISGLFIFWDRPFVIGDLVEINGQYGRVETITMRSTRVVTVDGKMLAIPNSVIANNTVTSYTNFPNIRLDVEVTVAVTENISRVRDLLQGMVQQHPEYLKEPAPTVVVRALNDYNILMELRIWLKDEKRHIPERFLLRERIFNTLNDAGVEMPYETLALAPIEVRQVQTG